MRRIDKVIPTVFLLLFLTGACACGPLALSSAETTCLGDWLRREPPPPQDGTLQYGKLVGQRYLLLDGGVRAVQQIVLTEEQRPCESLGLLTPGIKLTIVPPVSWDGGSTSPLCLGPSLELEAPEGAAEYSPSALTNQSSPRKVVVTLTATDGGWSARYVIGSASTTEVGVATVERCP